MQMLSSFDKSRPALLAFYDKQKGHPFEASQVKLLKHRMRYIWTVLKKWAQDNSGLIKGDRQVWFVGDWERCFDLFVVVSDYDTLFSLLMNSKKLQPEFSQLPFSLWVSRFSVLCNTTF